MKLLTQITQLERYNVTNLTRLKGTKGSQDPKKSFVMSFKKPGELFLKMT